MLAAHHADRASGMELAQELEYAAICAAPFSWFGNGYFELVCGYRAHRFPFRSGFGMDLDMHGF